MTSTLRSQALLLALAVIQGCDGQARSAPTPVTIAADSMPPTTGTTGWLIGPDPGADFLRADASESSLRARFGPSAVRTDSIPVGEGMSELGTVLFPGDSARELAIVWQDSVARARPDFVYVNARKSTWRLYPGVGIGTDLRTLESLNGRAFHLFGFGWDYSGTTSSFDEGRLDSLWRRDSVPGQAVLLRLDPEGIAFPDPLLTAVEGERVFSSQDSAMQMLNPRVYQILVRPR